MEIDTKVKSKRWIARQVDHECAQRIARETGVSEILARLLCGRGITDAISARSFLNPSVSQLHDPFLMLGMREAVNRLLRAIEAREPILVYGDYDVDGTTGTVVLRRALKLLGAETGYHIPHRFTEGYGINQPSLERAVADGFKIVVSVDCGIRSHEQLHWAKANGLDVIVTDHHLPDEDEGSPPAFAVLNPNQKGCTYPDKNLAGVGVAFKLAHALFREFNREHLVDGFLKMVAIGTVADVAKLIGENRSIVALGLADLPQAKNPGLRALIDVAGIGTSRAMTAYDLGFRIGPRINAAGRMDSGRAVVELFEAEDPVEARRLAEHLDSRNTERRTVQTDIYNRAVEEFEATRLDSHSYVAVISGAGWHRGVIGIAASKIAEKLYRPCLVISIEDGIGHGSGRSIEAYHLLDGMTNCADLFEKFGGHSHAAGFTIREKNIPQLRSRLNEHARSTLAADDLVPTINFDSDLSVSDITLDLAHELHALEPFGAGNPRPIFMTRAMQLPAPPFVMKERHLKLRIKSGVSSNLEAVWWGGVEEESSRSLAAGTKLDMVYSIETNTWRDETRLQLVVKDVKIGA